MFDPYVSGEMIWLEIDAMIRQQSAGKKSLDDFAKLFFARDDNGDVTKTYSFDDMVGALNSVQPYDWRDFLRSRLDDYGHGKLAHSIDNAGYALVFTDKPISKGPPAKALDLAYSLGMRVSAAGAVSAVHWGGPAFNANITIGETIVSVNGKPYDPPLFIDAIREAAKGGSLNLVLKRGSWQQNTSITWQGGMRYPHLQRISGKPDILSEILTPK